MDGLVTFQIMFRLNALSVCCLVKQNHPAIEINNMLHLAAACFKSTVVFFECRFFYLRIKNIKEKEEGIWKETKIKKSCCVSVSAWLPKAILDMNPRLIYEIWGDWPGDGIMPTFVAVAWMITCRTQDSFKGPHIFETFKLPPISHVING